MTLSTTRIGKAVCRCLMVLLAVGAAGCSYLGWGGDNADERSFRMLYSPNGEPLRGGSLGRPSCEAAMTGWFARVDANNDGRIGRDEFLADARRQFAVMDIDGDGTITPAELDKYRAPYRTVPIAAGADRSEPARSRGAASAQSSSDEPDPVMAADTRLRFMVTRQEFLDHADVQFTQLDRNRNGMLERDEVLKTCPAE